MWYDRLAGVVAAWLRARGGRGALAAAVSVAVLLGAFVLVAWLAVVAVADQWPSITASVDEAVADLVDTTGADVDTAEQIGDDLKAGAAAIVEFLLKGVARLLPILVSAAATVLLGLFVAFFYLKDGAQMWRWVVARAGEPAPLLDRVGRRVWTALSSFILGQTAIAAIDAAFISLGAIVLGVPHIGAVFMLTFFGAYVPFIGATLSGMLAVLLAVSDGGVSRGLWMLGIVLLVQVIEGNVLQPWIQGRAMRLHPMVVALAVTLGGAIAGFLGVLLAVPVAAAVLVALSELRAAGYLGNVES
jgi:predicted PurR-regulated permease PerM